MKPKELRIGNYVVPEEIPPELWREALTARHKNMIREKIEVLMKDMTEDELHSLWVIAEKIEHVNKVVELFKDL